jgi:hypothetical protein
MQTDEVLQGVQNFESTELGQSRLNRQKELCPLLHYTKSSLSKILLGIRG